jgi:hypothetical protein
MKKLIRIICSICALGFIANTAHTATLSILPASSEAFVSDPITITIDGTEFSESVDSVGITINWDPTILEYTGISIPNPPWDVSLVNDTRAITDGILDSIYAGSYAGVGTDFQLAQLTFTPLAVGTADISFGTSGSGCAPGTCGAYARNNELLIDYEQAQINVVPIPGAVWLFGSGLLGLLGMVHRKSKS